MTSALRVNLTVLDTAYRFQPLSGKNEPGVLSLCVLMLRNITGFRRGQMLKWIRFSGREVGSYRVHERCFVAISKIFAVYILIAN